MGSSGSGHGEAAAGTSRKRHGNLLVTMTDRDRIVDKLRCRSLMDLPRRAVLSSIGSWLKLWNQVFTKP